MAQGKHPARFLPAMQGSPRFEWLLFSPANRRRFFCLFGGLFRVLTPAAFVLGSGLFVDPLALRQVLPEG